MDAHPLRYRCGEGTRQASRPPGRPQAEIRRLASKVMALVAKGRSYRLIGREVGLSKNTVADIVKRHRANATQTA
jgi:putative DNA-invertase from lambdoid prophage Rac